MTTRFMIVFLAACGGGGGSTDIEATLRFADRTDTEISRLVAAASGSEGFQAQSTLSSFDDPSSTDPCPAVTITGSTVTLTGGCTTKNGVMIEGDASVTNPIGRRDVEYDFRSDTHHDLHGFAFVQAGTRRAYDGAFTISAGYSELDMNLTTDELGASVRSDIFMDCGTSRCTISGSGVELVGVGGAKVSGTVTVLGSTATASYTLKGVDTVKVTVANNCVSWQLEGTDRKLDPCQRP